MEFLLFIIGGNLYTVIEILWRGFTHWTMFLLGGLCFVIVGLLNEYKFSWKDSFLKQSVLGAVIVTIFEFVVGCIVNLWLGWNVWDYSDVPFNLFGQLCLGYFFLWIPLVSFGIILDDWIRYWIYVFFKKYFTNIEKREKPHYRFI